ncbi:MULTISPECIES: hypothetical protein [Heyndrickxia]|uniref:hypothetical protein n=1 Tax=Heyndrickxia TaxID=2837504 RepID=UPI000A66DF10|nr:hypothetical protein [Heyndrickxia shackletonii]MBB2482893.1 hypothetical protein [Bacillus sp. APMAM]NEZ01401.1 hypothetical protein [Heyndrickxia shackletonii]
MEISSLINMIFGVLLVIISFVSLLVSKRKGRKNKWAGWVILIGSCAIITAVVNLVVLH